MQREVLWVERARKEIAVEDQKECRSGRR